MIWDSLMILGDKNLALTFGALLALRQLLKSKLQGKPDLAESVKSALQSAGVIILITGMGGAFGGILQQTSLGLEVSALSSKLWITGHLGRCLFYDLSNPHCTGKCHRCHGYLYWYSWRTRRAGNRYPPVYLALAIGCGAKPIPWMNDSGFWWSENCPVSPKPKLSKPFPL